MLSSQARLANVPTWKAQLTGRGISAGLVLGALFTIVVHKVRACVPCLFVGCVFCVLCVLCV